MNNEFACTILRNKSSYAANLPTNIRLFCIIMHVTFCLNLAV